jgi:hypothetical protein
LDKSGHSGEPTAVPLGWEVLEQIKQPLDQAALGALLSLVYNIGPLSASLSVARSNARGLCVGCMMIVHCAMEAEAYCALSGLDPSAMDDDKHIFNIEAFAKTDWEALAKLAREPVDIPGWKRWAKERSELEVPDP